jgi:hypothetical protein
MICTPRRAMRTFYSEYVQHCMKFYARHPNPKFKSSADKLNWNACEAALKGFTAQEQDILLNVYTEGDTIPNNVYKVSIENSVAQNTVLLS